MKLGLHHITQSAMINLNFSTEDGWEWFPGETENGSNYPTAIFDEPVISDKYWRFQWLCFSLFFARGYGY
jgi:hypothetical protein